jgi:hypothetical protein
MLAEQGIERNPGEIQKNRQGSTNIEGLQSNRRRKSTNYA